MMSAGISKSAGLKRRCTDATGSSCKGFLQRSKAKSRLCLWQNSQGKDPRHRQSVQRKVE